MIMPSFPQDWTKYSSFCAEGLTPVYRGLPQSDLSRRERGHTLHAVGNINSSAREKTLPLTSAPQLMSAIAPLFKLCWTEHSGPGPSATFRGDPLSADLTGVFSGAEVTALQC